VTRPELPAALTATWAVDTPRPGETLTTADEADHASW
jgi:hypothetical protein